MLSHEERDQIAAAYKALPDIIPNFRSRPQQRGLVAFIAHALVDGALAMGEAPTAVGKSIGYLLPAAVLAIMRKKKAIISTATVMLQEQIMDRDANAVMFVVEKALGRRPKIALLRGRGRFACNIKLEQESRSADLFTENATHQQSLVLHKALTSGEWKGDIDSAPIEVQPVVWRALANDRHSCRAKACSQYKACPYYLAQTEVKEADVIVTNHDKLLTTLANDSSGDTLPELADAWFIFDEAHHLPAKALTAFAQRFECTLPWLHQLAAIAKGLDAGRAVPITKDIATLTRRLSEINVDIEADATGKTCYRVIGEPNALIARHYRATVSLLDRMFDNIAAICKRDPKKRLSKQDEMDTIRLNGFVGRLQEFQESFCAFFDADANVARWLEKTGPAWAGCVSPFEAGKILHQHLWRDVGSAVMVSATLTPCGEFNPMLVNMGLYGNDRVRTLQLDSPLDFSRACLRIPVLEHSPEQVVGHTRDVINFLASLEYDEGGTLALFSSKKQMTDVYDGLPPSLRLTILMQGQASMAELLRKHRAKVSNAMPSILFGMYGMSEGLDLPGNQCVRVVIAKIPFPSPDSPVLSAAADNLESKGLHPFPLLLLPEASIRLKQSVGRLIRTEDDFGEVILLDSRARTKSYAKQLLAGLPMKTRYN